MSVPIEYNREEIRERFKDLFDYSLDLIYVNDLDGNFLDANDVALKTFGYEPPEVPKLSFIDLLDKENSAKAYKMMKVFKEDRKQTFQNEYNLKNKDGNIIFLETYGIPLKKNGNIYAVLGIAKDITNIKKAEQRLKESEEKYRYLFENAQVGLYWSQISDGKFLECNEIFAKLFGYETREDFLAEYIATEHYVDPNQRTAILDEIRNKGEVRGYEILVTKRDGTPIYLSISARMFENEDRIEGAAIDITDRKMVENKLIESEEKYRSMINNLDVGFYKTTLDGIMLDHNRAHNTILNYNPSESLIGKEVSGFWQHPEDRKNYVNQILKNNYAKNFICPALTKDGKGVIVQLNSHLIRNQKGEPTGIEGTFIDITETFNLEQELRESEEKFRSISEESLIGIAILQDDKVKYINQHFANLSGYSVKEIKNWDMGWFINAIHPEDRDKVKEQGKRKQLGLKDVKNYYQYRLKTKTGKTIWLDNFSKTIIYEGRPADLVTVVNISERKLAEQRLKESEIKYRHLYESTPISIVLLNYNGVIVDTNPRTSEMFGYDREELIGKNFKDISVFHPEYNSTVIQLFKRFIKGEELHRVDLKMYKKDGTIFWANLQAALVNIEGLSYVEAIFTDINTRKEAEFLVQEELKKLKELDQIRKNLISRVSHELKTPLVSVSGGYELLLTLYKDQFNEDALEIIELIGKGSKRLKALVDNLVDVSRIEYNKFKLIRRVHNLSEIIREISRELMYSIRERKLNISLILPETLEIEVDRIRLEQVIMNLLSNAIKNTPPNGDILITLEKIDNWAKFSVTDSGIGLTKKEMGMLFTRFGKIERYGKGFEYINIQGSGLGLYIAKEIVDMHNGEIYAESEGRNMGSTFTVKLPLK